MAEIIPIKALRYNKAFSKEIESLTSPLFDVVSDHDRNRLYSNPFNSIHLSVPQGDEPAKSAVKILETWKEKGVVIQDNVPGIYVYYQYFTIPGEEKQYCRKGFICNIRIYEWEEDILLRHENTIPASVNDRVKLLEETQLQASPTHGLYSDPTFELEKYMDESISDPIYSIEDYQGVRDVLSVIHDKKIIQTFITNLKEKQVILADGHHRYESALIHKQKSAVQNPGHTGREGYNFHLMYFTNIESDDLKILPTHRLIQNVEGFDEEKFITGLQEFFHLQPVERNISRMGKSIEQYKWMFGLVLPSFSFLIQLKSESFSILNWHFPEKVKELDLTVLHFFIIEKLLGIKGKDQRKSEKILFERSLSVCEEKVNTGQATMAILTRPVTMKEIKEVCYSGYTMPQKSTYFYPKVICGFLFNSIKENEFTLSDSCF